MHQRIATACVTDACYAAVLAQGSAVPQPIWDEIGHTLCEHEQHPLMVSHPRQAITVRLKGSHFPPAVLPVSSSSSSIMKGITHSLLREFEGICAMSCGPSITLLLPSVHYVSHGALSTHPYEGRRDKLCSLTASLASHYYVRHTYAHGLLDPLDGSHTPIVFEAQVGMWPDVRAAFGVLLWQWNVFVTKVPEGTPSTSYAISLYTRGLCSGLVREIDARHLLDDVKDGKIVVSTASVISAGAEEDTTYPLYDVHGAEEETKSPLYDVHGAEEGTTSPLYDVHEAEEGKTSPLYDVHGAEEESKSPLYDVWPFWQRPHLPFWKRPPQRPFWQRPPTK